MSFVKRTARCFFTPYARAFRWGTPNEGSRSTHYFSPCCGALVPPIGLLYPDRRRGRRMSEPLDLEIEAIKAVLAALAPLSEKARVSVLDYVTRRLELPTQPARVGTVTLVEPLTPLPGSSQEARHIK